MRIAICVILFLFQLANLTAQETKITLNIKDAPVTEILRQIEQQTNLGFSFETSLLKDFPRRTFQVKDKSLEFCLNKLFQNTSIEYRIIGKSIILKRKSKKLTISGYIYDSVSKETLIGASIYDKASGQSTIANNYGFYSLSIPEGIVSLYISYVGYGAYQNQFSITQDTVINCQMDASYTLQEVVVEPEQQFMASMNDTQLGALNIQSSTFNKVPAMLGEVDVLKVLQQTPGVTVGTEGFSGMYVRGGNKDENLYLIDGNPIYDVNHLMGFVSTFNPDAIKETRFYKGSFPARYSGRLSSVVDTRTKDGDMQRYHGTFSIGLLSAKANVEGPIIKDKMSFNASYRRTYADVLAAPMLYYVNKNENSNVKLGYYFHDLNAKINYKFSERSRLYLNVYNGRDAFKTGEKSEGDYRDYETGQYEYSYYSQNLLKWNWGNLVTSLNWNYVFNNKLFGNMNLVYTKFNSDINYTDDGNRTDSKDAILEENHLEMKYQSGIEDIGFRANFDYIPQSNHYIRFGGNFLHHTFLPEESSIHSKSSYATEEMQDTTFHDNRIYGNEFSTYVEDEITLSSRFKVNLGLNFSAFEVQGKVYPSLQPRFSTNYLLKDNFSVKASYAMMTQYIHQLSMSYLNLPTDLWVPVTPQIEPMKSQQVSAGIYYTFKKEWDFSLEGYYKNMDNLIEYKDGAVLFSKTLDWQKKVAIGNGRSYGGELMVQRKQGKTTGWASYSLSWADRQFPGGEINQGKRFWAKYDNRHKFNIVINHKLSKNIDLNLSWVYYTGNRITLPLEGYQGAPGLYGSPYHYQNYIFNKHQPSGEIQYVESRNNYKLGDYNRLDIGFNFYRPKKNGRMGIWNVSVYNAYCKMNPFYVYPTMKQSYNGNQTQFHWGLEQVTYFPIVPSVSYTYKF